MIVVCRDTQTCTVTEHQLDPFTHELHATRVELRIVLVGLPCLLLH